MRMACTAPSHKTGWKTVRLSAWRNPSSGISRPVVHAGIASWQAHKLEGAEGALNHVEWFEQGAVERMADGPAHNANAARHVAQQMHRAQHLPRPATPNQERARQKALLPSHLRGGTERKQVKQ